MKIKILGATATINSSLSVKLIKVSIEVFEDNSFEYIYR